MVALPHPAEGVDGIGDRVPDGEAQIPCLEVGPCPFGPAGGDDVEALVEGRLPVGEQGGERRSTHDLVAPGRFLLLAGRDAGAWMAQAAALRDDDGAALDAAQIGSPSGPVSDRAIEGLADDGAVLVRPDGHVGWRAAGPPEGDGALAAALSRVLSAGAVGARA